MSEPHIDVFTDGACSGNPGPGGWGAILRAGAHEKEISGGEAQMLAIGRALMNRPQLLLRRPPPRRRAPFPGRLISSPRRAPRGCATISMTAAGS